MPKSQALENKGFSKIGVAAIISILIGFLQRRYVPVSSLKIMPVECGNDQTQKIYRRTNCPW